MKAANTNAGTNFGVAHIWIALHFTSGAAIAENLINTGKWPFFVDTVMGGVSEGDARYVNSDIGKALRQNAAYPPQTMVASFKSELKLHQGLLREKRA